MATFGRGESFSANGVEQGYGGSGSFGNALLSYATTRTCWVCVDLGVLSVTIFTENIGTCSR